MNLTPTQIYSQQTMSQQQQQQQHQMLGGGNSSTSPTNSYLSSSSSTASSSYSPLSTQAVNGATQQQQQQQQQQQAQQQQQQVSQMVANTTGPALYMTTTGPNGSPLILSIPANAGGVSAGQNNNNTASVNFNDTFYQTMSTQKPEAKKVKIQKSQPSKVVHIRNIPPQISEVEVIQFGLIFGSIANVLNLRSKCQAFLEFEKCEEAQSMINYFANNPITVAGRQIFVQYSNYKSLVTDPSNTNNQIAKAALDMAKELHKAAQTGGQNTVLRAMLQNMLYPVTLDTIYQIFGRYGPVLKIITFTKNDKFQALIQMKDAVVAQAAKNSLHGQNIYSGCCTLHIDYSKLNTLNVKYNNEKSRDYTNPLLPAGDCPDPLLLGNVLSAAPLQLPAGMSYGPPAFSTGLPAGYQAFAQNPNPFLTTFPKYLTNPFFTTHAGLLQQTTANTLQSLSALQSPTPQNAAAAAAAANGGQSTTVQQQQQQLQQQQQQSANANGSAAAAAAYANLNGLSLTNATLNSINNHNQAAAAAAAAHANSTQSGQQQLLIPIVQNLNDDGYIMMFTSN